MDRKFQGQHYTSQKVKDRSAGYEGYELLCQMNDGEPVRVAWLVYWDAAPGFFFETFTTNISLPLGFLEEFIAEVMANMKG